MTAHEIDDAAKRLGELKSATVEDAALAAVAFGLALAAAWYGHPLAAPLALGAMAMTFLAVRAFVKRFVLVDELAADEDAYRIPAVRDFGTRAASLQHRRVLAANVRASLAGDDRLEPARPDLEQLVRALEVGSTRWEPQAVVRLEHWLQDPHGSFRDPELPAVELRSHVRSVLASLGPQEIQAARGL